MLQQSLLGDGPLLVKKRVGSHVSNLLTIMIEKVEVGRFLPHWYCRKQAPGNFEPHFHN